MKKHLLLFISVSLFFVTLASAQIKKGATFLGGDIRATVEKSKANGSTVAKQNSLFVSPVFGKAIKDNLVLGADVTIGFVKNTEPVFSGYDRDDYGAAVFLRQYKPLGKSGFLLFLQGRVAYDYTDIEYHNSAVYNENSTRHNISLSANPGISYAVSKQLQLETGFNNLLSMNYYGQRKHSGATNFVLEKTTGFGIVSSLNNGSALYVGFRLLFN